MNFSKWLPQTRSQANGAAFETAFEIICNQNGFSWLRIPNACKQIGKNKDGSPKLIRIKSPFDYLIAHKGFSACIDTKSTEHHYWKYSDNDPDQLRELMNMRDNMLAGYLIHHPKLDLITFHDVLVLNKMRPRESLQPSEGIILGTFGYKCDLHLLKVHY